MPGPIGPNEPKFTQTMTEFCHRVRTTFDRDYWGSLVPVERYSRVNLRGKHELDGNVRATKDSFHYQKQDAAKGARQAKKAKKKEANKNIQ